MDADIYDYNNLIDEDKSKIDLLLSVNDKILTEKKVDDYLGSKTEFGPMLKDASREVLLPFIAFLQEEITCMSLECIVEAIDSYPEPNYIKNKKEN